MTFIVTARKWRPQLFADVVGQQHISTTLKNAIENNRIGHAYIFAGPRGVGKTTTARILAKRLNCQSPNGGEPCNSCSSCLNFLRSQSLDIIEIDGASNRRIDEIRTLRESVKYAPTSGEYKVYIIDEVHMLTTESFNALLKTLEEPPEHTIFIFATTDIHKVPLTIISRCQRFDFRRIELEDIKTLLKSISIAEKINIDDESLTIIAKKADGALRDAESIFDQVVSFCGTEVDANFLKQMLNLIDDEVFFQISEAVLNNDFKVGFEVSEKVYTNGWNFIDFINGLLEHFRNISSVVITKSVNFIESSELLKTKYLEYSNKFSEGDLLRILSFLSKSQNELRFSQNQKLKVEISLTHLIGFSKSSTITELLSKVTVQKTPETKNKTEILEKANNSNPKLSSPSQFKIELPKPTNNKVITIPQKEAFNTTQQEDQEKTVSKLENSLEYNFESINNNWKTFKEIITKEKFTLGPLLSQTIPASFENNSLNIHVEHKEDEQIFLSSKEFLTKRFSELFSIDINMKFVFKENLNTNSSNSYVNKTELISNDEYKDHPIVKSVISDLGGREIK